ncbi:MAG: sigma-70 family RNA polymerase sigma factor [Solirubrobacterales bacterium]|nr:sigma-70 family RNA polymerase sigma factor [Solirubrobacterales bacterium]MCB0863832.1 sigma-70 family RNA polymerase sigma factor [Solirubrobacterales bacterium]MCB8915362.1 sigma-70 family RNA polymerase sigma factor [Thermoleophilales bacterium]
MGRDKDSPEQQFERVFAHYGMIEGFARRRGSRDSAAIAAETLSIAWRRLDELDPHACRPWLLATARNLLLAEYRAHVSVPVDPSTMVVEDPTVPDYEIDSLDPAIDRALASLEPLDREALLLVAWEELTPKEAAASLGIRPATFRVRLHRARRRFEQALEPESHGISPATEVKHQ